MNLKDMLRINVLRITDSIKHSPNGMIMENSNLTKMLSSEILFDS